MTAQLERRSDLGHDANDHSLWSAVVSIVILRCYAIMLSAVV